MTQRMRSGGTAKAAASAGKAMLTVESRDTTKAPAAAIQRDMSDHHGTGRRGSRARRACNRARPTVQRWAVDLQAGATHEISLTVADEHTADRFGNRGVRVFATPAV